MTSLVTPSNVEEPKEIIVKGSPAETNAIFDLGKDWEHKISVHNDAMFNISKLRTQYCASVKKYHAKIVDNELQKIEQARYLDLENNKEDKNNSTCVKNDAFKLMKLSVSSLEKIDFDSLQTMDEEIQSQLTDAHTMLYYLN